MVVVIVGAAYVLASLGSEQKIPLNIGPFLLMVLGLMLFAHLAVRRLAPDADPILLPVAALLNGIGLLLLPLVPGVGRAIHGSRIWVSLGPIGFQPGDLAKISLAIFFASYLV